VNNTLDKAGIKRNNPKPAIFKELSKPEKALETKAAPVPTITPTPTATPEEEKDTKLCKKCGEEIASNFKFCPYCGEKVKSEGELIYEGLLAARVKALQFVPDSCKNKVDKQLIDASEYLRFLMKKTGQM